MTPHDAQPDPGFAQPPPARPYDPPRQDRVLPQQLSLLHGALPAALIANLVITVTVLLVIWPVAAGWPLAIWAALAALITAGRAALYRRWPRSGIPAPEAPRWRRLATLGSFLSGLVWGALPLLLGPAAPLEHQMFLGVVLAGLGAGALAALGTCTPVFRAFALPALLPFALLMLGGEGPMRRAMGILALLFLGSLIVIARKLERAVLQLFQLQETNGALVKRLTLARDAESAAAAAKNALIGRLEESRHEAEAANQAKSTFLAIMSHELRTPLNAIIGFADVIRTESLGPIDNPRYREYISDIRESGVHLLELINKILDLSKIEAGKFELVRMRIETEPVIRSVLRLFREQATAAGVLLEPKIAPEAAHLWGDERSVKQMLINLLSNALKFAPRGSAIQITAEAFSDSIELAVADRGIGIAPEDVEKALEPFTQLGDPMTRRHEGTGLGLSLVKAMIELHGGTLTIDATPGGGTTVRLKFPVYEETTRAVETLGAAPPP